MARLQEKLYAQDQWGVLLIFQAMDAAGKDGAIKHVMSGINPQGCEVYSFKTPSQRSSTTTSCGGPEGAAERGRIGIFNRSYYEETLVVRVHPELLDAEQLPRAVVTKHIWKERFEDINAFERLPDPQRLRHPQVLPARFAQGAAPALSRAARPSREELEVLDGRRRRARALARLHGRLRGDDPRTPRRRTPRG